MRGGEPDAEEGHETACTSQGGWSQEEGRTQVDGTQDNEAQDCEAQARA
jgi:hypothetical protein